MSVDVDIIIIGAGMAGLYTAYQLALYPSNLSFRLLESEDRVGGRAYNTTFDGTRIAPGAGIGRAAKDWRLARLMTDVGMEVKEFPFKPNYSKPHVDILRLLAYLRQVYESLPSPRPRISFATFGKKILGRALFHEFVYSTGYTDYLREDVSDVLYHYGMDDNACCWQGFGVDWTELANRMVRVIGRRRIQLGVSVQEIRPIKHRWELLGSDTNSENLRVWRCKRVVIATAIPTIRALLPSLSSVYSQIQGQPFMRAYAKVDEESSAKLKKVVPRYTVVPGPLQKLIPIDAKKGIYMIAYNDNKNAQWVHAHLHDKELIEHVMEQSLNLPSQSIEIESTAGYFWPVGTHFYLPLRGFSTRQEFVHTAQRPYPNVWVVGEAVSMNQGWVEGALQSVDEVISEIVQA